MTTVENLQKVTTDIDPNVIIPNRVKAAADAADALYKSVYSVPPDQKPGEPTMEVTEPAKEAAPDPAAEEAARADAARIAAQATQSPQNEHTAEPKADDANVSEADWRHRFLSMQGRYNKAAQTIGAMEQQMTELGQELVRVQNILQSQTANTQPANQQISQVNHEHLITDDDISSYGTDLIDMAKRAAREAVSPELARIQAENAKLTQQVQSTAKRELFSQLDRQLPQWRQINQDVRFKSWLRLPNIYTGQVRQAMLNDAVNGAHAPKVLAFFKDFLAEAAATGQTAPAQQDEQQTIAPRTPAMNLETLAAPGRARPASGDNQSPSEKPIYTRAAISKFYDEKRRGLWANRKAEADALEVDLGLAQREGRIR
jgi:hypothetical protein